VEILVGKLTFSDDKAKASILKEMQPMQPVLHGGERVH
jgi:hypothetical protein